MILSLRKIQYQSIVGHGKRDKQKISKILNFIEKSLPAPWNIGEVKEKFPVRYDQSLNLFFVKEIDSFNRLLTSLREKLTKI